MLCCYSRKDNYQIRMHFPVERLSMAFYWLSAFSSYNLQNCCNSIPEEAAAKLLFVQSAICPHLKEKKKSSSVDVVRKLERKAI